MFRAAESGLPTDLRKLISRKFSTAQDKCGRTVLHRAILKKSKHVIKFLAENYTNIIEIPDNVNNNVFFFCIFFPQTRALFKQWRAWFVILLQNYLHCLLLTFEIIFYHV